MRKISRRDFFKLSAAAGVRAALLTRRQPVSAYLPEFPPSELQGRTFHSTDVKLKPNPDSETVEQLYEDSVVEWQREVIGEAPSLYSTNRKWVETPKGYIPSINLQPVRSQLNPPL